MVVLLHPFIQDFPDNMNHITHLFKSSGTEAPKMGTMPSCADTSTLSTLNKPKKDNGESEGETNKNSCYKTGKLKEICVVG